MNTQHDRLDEAIDQVAKRMTRVEDSAALANRILTSLPDRSPWLLHSWIPRLAITAALAAAASLVVLRMFDEPSAGVQTDVQTDVPADVPTDVPTDVQTDVPTNVLLSARPNDRLNDRLNARPNDRPNARLNDPDHERSLEAIASPAALALATLAPSDLPGQGALVVLPLAIEELPLTTETISPR